MFCMFIGEILIVITDGLMCLARTKQGCWYGSDCYFTHVEYVNPKQPTQVSPATYKVEVALIF